VAIDFPAAGNLGARGGGGPFSAFQRKQESEPVSERERERASRILLDK